MIKLKKNVRENLIKLDLKKSIRWLMFLVSTDALDPGCSFYKKKIKKKRSLNSPLRGGKG